METIYQTIRCSILGKEQIGSVCVHVYIFTRLHTIRKERL